MCSCKMQGYVELRTGSNGLINGQTDRLSRFGTGLALLAKGPLLRASVMYWRWVRLIWSGMMNGAVQPKPEQVHVCLE